MVALVVDRPDPRVAAATADLIIYVRSIAADVSEIWTYRSTRAGLVAIGSVQRRTGRPEAVAERIVAAYPGRKTAVINQGYGTVNVFVQPGKSTR